MAAALAWWLVAVEPPLRARANAFMDQKGARLDGEGRFTLRAAKPGRHWLALVSGGAQLSLPFDLEPGANTWERDLPVGSVQLDNLPLPSSRPTPRTRTGPILR